MGRTTDGGWWAIGVWDRMEPGTAEDAHRAWAMVWAQNASIEDAGRTMAIEPEDADAGIWAATLPASIERAIERDGGWEWADGDIHIAIEG